MELQLSSSDGMKKNIEVSATVFGREYNQALVHQVVTAYLAGQRAGTAAQKTRAEVSGGGRKPWNQKGTGRARAGSIRSPIWIGGGVTFAAKPRDYSQKVNRKMYRGAMLSILSELARTDRLVVVEDLALERPKTKELLAKLGELNLSSALIVTGHFDENVYLASRNIKGVSMTLADTLNPVQLLKFKKVLITVGAIRKLEEVFNA